MKRRLCSLTSIFLAAFLASCGGSALGPTTANPPAFSAGRHASPAGASPNGYQLLYSFKGTPDGASPFGGLIAFNGALYGTTLNGSSNYCSQSCSNYCYRGCGTVFSITKSGIENVIYNFRGNFNSAHDGSWPFAGLTPLNGTFYGTASSAGANAAGAVYTVNASGQESIVYSFAGGSADGQSPEANLIAYKGKLFGTTVSGGGSGCGGSGCGIVYSVTTNGTETVLHRFSGGNDGAHLYAPITHLGRRFYGATLEGGGTGCGGNGCGAIFELTTHGKEKVLYRFTGAADGAFPNGLTVANGVLYGTTEGGGARSSGTFFSATTSGALTTLYSFKDIPDGNLPGATLIVNKGTFYGTTVGGGTAGQGTVYSITPAGTETVLYSFGGGSDGADPQGPVYLFDKMLYGTTTAGGGTGCSGGGCGTVFKVKP